MQNAKKEMNLNSENQVVMSNALIKSKSHLGLNELKLLRLTIMQIIKTDTELMTYKIKIKELGELLNIDKDNLYKEVDSMTTNLLREIVYIGTGNPKNKWEKFQWCSYCKYDNGIITIKLHDELKPHLLNLSELYTQYVLDDILHLKSVHSIRIYELIREEMKYQKVYADKEANIYLSIKTIRQITNTEDKYTKYGMLKKRVIDTAVNEINNKLQYYVTYEQVKEGKKVVGFNINIKSKILTELSKKEIEYINKKIERKKKENKLI